MNALLYSTNPYLKFHINQKFRKGVHYVWCSEFFDGDKRAAYALGGPPAPSSNPCTIYQELKRDVAGSDRHSAKINSVKASLLARADEWHAAGEVSADQRDDIIYMVTQSLLTDWRPLIYVIPVAGLDLGRIVAVPPARRASLCDEYIIADLKSQEFDIIEP